MQSIIQQQLEHFVYTRRRVNLNDIRTTQETRTHYLYVIFHNNNLSYLFACAVTRPQPDLVVQSVNSSTGNINLGICKVYPIARTDSRTIIYTRLDYDRSTVSQ